MFIPYGFERFCRQDAGAPGIFCDAILRDGLVKIKVLGVLGSDGMPWIGKG